MSSSSSHTHHNAFSGLFIGAIGVVYGDIGTSPLYALKEVFAGVHKIPHTPDNILGILSLIFWALTLVVGLKYIVFIMASDNRGEGGIMALLSLALHKVKGQPHLYAFITILGIFGVALFYGDGMITPAISVLSAVEGLKIAEPMLEPFVVPITIGILFCLFLIQQRGTAKVGQLFGPVMLIWFCTLALLGLCEIIKSPTVLQAINPWYAVHFFWHNGWIGFIALGSVVLVLTGAEALYADMGHFGRKPITAAWISFVFPALLLNYFGQGALLLDSQHEVVQNPFYLLAPEWALLPLIFLSTAATIIASQAVISGTFSMTQQASRLGFIPRVEVIHTSEEKQGQIYIPTVNWLLFVAVSVLVLGFQTSDNLAAAYGLAVTGTMLVTTILAFIVIHKVWRWSLEKTLPIILLFFIIDFSFFSANLLKIPDGGWLPLLIGFVFFILMTTWKKGNQLLLDKQHDNALGVTQFIKDIITAPPTRVSGTAIFLTSNPLMTPRALLHNLMHNKVLHEKVVFMKVLIEGIPHIPPHERVEIMPLKAQFYTVTVRFGFKDDLNVPTALANIQYPSLNLPLMETSFFIGRASLMPALHSKLYRWQEKLFLMMYRNGISLSRFLKIPPNRVVELGTQIEV